MSQWLYHAGNSDHRWFPFLLSGRKVANDNVTKPLTIQDFNIVAMLATGHLVQEQGQNPRPPGSKGTSNLGPDPQSYIGTMGVGRLTRRSGPWAKGELLLA